MSFCSNGRSIRRHFRDEALAKDARYLDFVHFNPELCALLPTTNIRSVDLVACVQLRSGIGADPATSTLLAHDLLR